MDWKSKSSKKNKNKAKPPKSISLLSWPSNFSPWKTERQTNGGHKSFAFHLIFFDTEDFSNHLFCAFQHIWTKKKDNIKLQATSTLELWKRFDCFEERDLGRKARLNARRKIKQKWQNLILKLYPPLSSYWSKKSFIFIFIWMGFQKQKRGLRQHSKDSYFSIVAKKTVKVDRERNRVKKERTNRERERNRKKEEKERDK